MTLARLLPSSPDGLLVAVLIATRGRFDLLTQRALRSVLSQSRLPDKILVVLDHTKEELDDGALSALARSLKNDCGGRVPITVIRNRRTSPRASGAWNTGIDQLHRDRGIKAELDRWFVALIDDDDRWEPEHLEICVQEAARGAHDMVVAGLVRHGAPDDVGHPHAIAERLDARELFIRGQHIQGSNLFLRLRVLLSVGGFDEHLQSCTDRDLCLRIAALEAVRFGRVERHTVHHYADPRPDRLSIAASPAKLDGLTHFWRKHADRFDDKACREAARRAYELFGWVAPEAIAAAEAVPPPSVSSRAMSFVVGFVTDAEAPPHVHGLLDDLAALARRVDVDAVHVVIVENGPVPTGGSRPLHELVGRHRDNGLSVELVTIETQRNDWARGLLFDTPDPARQRLPIAVTRTVLSSYVARSASARSGAVAWILDDDKRLTFTVDRGDGVLIERNSPDIAALAEFRDAGVHVVIGPDTGAAPLPFVATLRMQLVDLEHLLAVATDVGPESPWPDRRAEVEELRSTLPDSYYDLARSTAHLETPFLLTARHPEFTAADAVACVAEKVDRLLAGEPVFRSLVVRAKDLPTHVARDSIHRGGSTVFFDPTHLVSYPQSLARIGDTHTRRSDMLVSQLMREQLGLRIVMHPAVAVHHDRSATVPASIRSGSLTTDVLGYAFYRAMDEIMAAREPDRRRAPMLAWRDAELESAVRLVRKYGAERLAVVTMSAWRVIGLAGAIRRLATSMLRGSSAWNRADLRRSLERIVDEMDRIAHEFRPAAVDELAEEIQTCMTPVDVRAAFSSMDALIAEYRARHSGIVAHDPAVADMREQRARALVVAHYPCGQLRLLGMGGEGVVLTDDVSVYKVLDLLKRRPNHDTLVVLGELRDRTDRPMCLCALDRVDLHDQTPVLVYAYEPSEPYEGGHGWALIELLRECKRHGIVFRNMHPKNLRLFGEIVRIIDYGSDIRRYSDAGYRSMAERAWLCWRWSHRPDLDDLMRQALVDETLPELQGFERFWRVLLEERPSATSIVAGLIDPIVLESGARAVLDYGCGKHAASSRRLAAAGLDVVGFDPATDVAARWADLGGVAGGPRLTASRGEALAAGPFDAAICSLVLCEVADGTDYERILADLRAAVKRDGVVVVALCNPLATFGRPTALHRQRHIPDGMTYEDRFAYTECAETDVARGEIHRPLRQLERDLLRHGLRIERRVESDAVDIERFEAASDFMVLVCRPLEVPGARSRTSLLIKTCAMEAATIERQVEHLVGRLEGPHVFAERVLAIDSRRDGFVRQHADGDLHGVEEAARRLLARGLVDRIVDGPSSGTRAREIVFRWFGVDSNATHTSAGAPLVTPLHAIETCVGEYVLQVDSDLLVGRADPTHDFLQKMIDALSADPLAVTASLNVARDADLSFSASESDVPWRVEVRGCLLHRERLLAGRPYANACEDGVPIASWHRSLDEAVRQGRAHSLRGGGRSTYFVHVPNDCKRSVPEWMLMLDLVEKRHLSPEQVGRVDLQGGPLAWVPRVRGEPVVFVITGRNVPRGRVLRCVESLRMQTGDWGAVVVDDGSDALHRECVEEAFSAMADRVTLLQPRERRGQLANMALAIRHVCTNPSSVIVTLDLDDALLGPGVADRVLAEHSRGADVTVGTMLRTDKHVEYTVDFSDPRRMRGGNCWQHLRSFRKALFDAIPDHELRIGRSYVDLACDWAFMLPIVEMATNPVWIRDPLYLYEPSGVGKGADRDARERQIGAITSRPSWAWARGKASTTLLLPERLSTETWGASGGILFVRHAERPRLAGLSDAERDGVRITPRGRAAAVSVGRALGPATDVVASPIPRASETALALAEGLQCSVGELCQLAELSAFKVAGADHYRAVAARLGWKGLMSAWPDGSLPADTLQPCEDVAWRAVEAVLRFGRGPRVVAVTHDFVLIALLAALRGERTTKVPYLAGVFVAAEEIARIIETRGGATQ